MQPKSKVPFHMITAHKSKHKINKQPEHELNLILLWWKKLH